MWALISSLWLFPLNLADWWLVGACRCKSRLFDAVPQFALYIFGRVVVVAVKILISDHQRFQLCHWCYDFRFDNIDTKGKVMRWRRYCWRWCWRWWCCGCLRPSSDLVSNARARERRRYQDTSCSKTQHWYHSPLRLRSPLLEIFPLILQPLPY